MSSPPPRLVMSVAVQPEMIAGTSGAVPDNTAHPRVPSKRPDSLVIPPEAAPVIGHLASWAWKVLTYDPPLSNGIASSPAFHALKQSLRFWLPWSGRFENRPSGKWNVSWNLRARLTPAANSQCAGLPSIWPIRPSPALIGSLSYGTRAVCVI